MGYVLYFLIFFILSLIAYFATLYGLYIPSKSRYIPTQCKAVNNTHSSALLQCRQVVFAKQMNGECFYDAFNKDMIMFAPEWYPLLLIVGVISIVCFVILILGVYWSRNPRTENRIASELTN